MSIDIHFIAGRQISSKNKKKQNKRSLETLLATTAIYFGSRAALFISKGAWSVKFSPCSTVFRSEFPGHTFSTTYTVEQNGPRGVNWSVFFKIKSCNCTPSVFLEYHIRYKSFFYNF